MSFDQGLVGSHIGGC